MSKNPIDIIVIFISILLLIVSSFTIGILKAILIFIIIIHILLI